MDERTEGRRGLRRADGIALAVAGIVAVVLAVLWLRQPADPVVLEDAPGALALAAAAASPETAPEPEAVPLVRVDPKRRQALLEAVSADETYRRWLAEPDVIRRWVLLTDNLAEGASPRKALRFLAPQGGFATEERGGERVIAPASYRRYDRFADAVGSIDAGAAAAAYGALRGALEPAYRALGYPHGSIDRVTARALARLAGAPVRDGEVAVEGVEGSYLFVDPKLEALPEVEKHLLRMGPRNTRILQAKARELQRAAGLPSEPGASR